MSREATRFAFRLCFIASIPYSLHAQSFPEDSLTSVLPEIEVKQAGRAPLRKDASGSFSISTTDAMRLSRSFGEVDLIDKIRVLPLTDTGSDYSSGISVNGTDASQAQYLIDGAPVIFPYRFGGVFSTFNATHFSSMNFSRISGADLAPRLGAAYQLSPAARFASGIEGECNVGMTASSATLRAGIQNRFSAAFSGRISYIDRLFGKWLASDNNNIKYNFNDLNASLAFKISDRDIINASFFRSADNLTYDDKHYALLTSIIWVSLSHV